MTPCFLRVRVFPSFSEFREDLDTLKLNKVFWQSISVFWMSLKHPLSREKFVTHNLSINRHRVAIMRMWISYYSVADPDLQIWGAGGEGAERLSRPWDKAVAGSQKTFCGPSGLSLWSKPRGVGGGTCPGSATAISLKIYWGIQLSRKVPRLFPRAPNTIKPFVTPLPSDIWRERGGEGCRKRRA